MKRIKSTKAWICNEKYMCKRHHECKPYGLPSCRPVRFYPEAQALLMERLLIARIDNAKDCSCSSCIEFMKQWAKLEEMK